MCSAEGRGPVRGVCAVRCLVRGAWCLGVKGGFLPRGHGLGQRWWGGEGDVRVCAGRGRDRVCVGRSGRGWAKR